jgi:hypothetical protein
LLGLAAENKGLFEIANAVGETVVLDLGVIDVVETSKVVVRAQNSRLDSESKFVADNHIAAAKLKNVLSVASKRRCSETSEAEKSFTSLKLTKSSIGLSRLTGIICAMKAAGFRDWLNIVHLDQQRPGLWDFGGERQLMTASNVCKSTRHTESRMYCGALSISDSVKRL